MFSDLEKSANCLSNRYSSGHIYSKDSILCSLIKLEMKSDIEIITDAKRIRPKKSEVTRLWCDNQKIKKLTGFKPNYDMASGLKETVNWFQQPSNLAKYKSDIYNI